MANFDEQSVYNKHQNNCNGDCGDNCSCNDDCGCCPPGLVSVTDCNGKHVACLTPNDAACYRVNSHIPPTGYVKVYFPLTGDDRVYYGDMTPQQAIDFIAALDPDVDPATIQESFEPATTDAVTLSAAGEGSTNNAAIDLQVDRQNCDDAITVAISGSFPTGMSFLSGATSLSISSGNSTLTNGILIDDQVAAGAYNLTLVYTGCGESKNKVLTVNVI